MDILLNAGTEKIIDYDLSHYDTAHVVFQPDKMTRQQLYNGYIWFYKQFYSFKNIRRRLPDSKKQRISYLCFSFLYRKFERFTEGLTKVIPLSLLGRFAIWLSYDFRRNNE